jgi:hypothetical protein
VSIEPSTGVTVHIDDFTTELATRWLYEPTTKANSLSRYLDLNSVAPKSVSRVATLCVRASQLEGSKSR